jgi:FtsP/CotA-like multicopper oxidase with cupredoxin domain
MSLKFSRRKVLASGAAALVAVPARRAMAASAMPLTVERRTLEVNGKPASVFGIRQDNGVFGAFLDPGQRFTVDLHNQAGEPTIIHWHGQTPPVVQDGVTTTGLETLIGNGAIQNYDYAPRPGTHWMHSHQGLQEQMLMAAPLVVRTADDLRADVQEVTVLLQDFTFRDPREILAGLTHGTSMQTGSATAMGGSAVAGTAMSGNGMSGMAMPMASTQTATVGMDLNDVDFDAYLANDRTLADPLIVKAERGGRVRLRLINGATSTAFWVDLGSLQGSVIAVDGDPVRAVAVRRFPIAEGQRVDVMLRLPPQGGAFPIIAQREGDRQRTGIVLATRGASIVKLDSTATTSLGAADISLERQLSATAPLSQRRVNRLLRVTLAGTMMPYGWTIDGRTWANHKPLEVQHGERVALDIVNQTTMAHPMHLHGHHFQVVALNGTPTLGAMRDTVLVPAKGSVRVAFDADNPGRWLFHCHNLYHMATGMITEVAYPGFVPGI